MAFLSLGAIFITHPVCFTGGEYEMEYAYSAERHGVVFPLHQFAGGQYTTSSGEETSKYQYPIHPL